MPRSHCLPVCQPFCAAHCSWLIYKPTLATETTRTTTTTATCDVRPVRADHRNFLTTDLFTFKQFHRRDHWVTERQRAGWLARKCTALQPEIGKQLSNKRAHLASPSLCFAICLQEKINAAAFIVRPVWSLAGHFVQFIVNKNDRATKIKQKHTKKWELQKYTALKHWGIQRQLELIKKRLSSTLMRNSFLKKCEVHLLLG